MDLTTLIAHFTNFCAPAVVLALVLPLAGRFSASHKPVPLAWWAQAAVVFVVCCAALLLGLWFFGRDGKMATYAAMVLAGGSVQWAMGLALWRRGQQG